MKATIEIIDAVDSRVRNKKDVELIWDLLCYKAGDRFVGKLKLPIIKSFIHRGSGKFATGLVPIVKRKLEKYGCSVEIKNTNYKKLKLNTDVPDLTVTLDDYQKHVLRDIEKCNRGLIISGTASGKSIMEAALMDMYRTPRTLVIVPTKDLLYQLGKELQRLLSLPKVGYLGDGKREVARVTVALYQTLSNYKLNKVNEQFDMVIIDEVQASRSDSYQIIMNQLPNIHYRYGFTGTMRMKQPDRYIIQGLVGKPIAIVPEEQTHERVAEVKMWMVAFKGEMQWRSKYHDRVEINIWNNKGRNMLIAQAIEYVNSLGLNCLILVEKYIQAKGIQMACEELHLSAPILWNKTPNDKREELKSSLNERSLMRLIATPAISVGTNIPNVDFLIVGSEVKSWVNLVQKVGRGRRKTASKQLLYGMDIMTLLGDMDRNFKKQSMKKRRVYSAKGWLQGVVDFYKFKEELKNAIGI